MTSILRPTLLAAALVTLPLSAEAQTSVGIRAGVSGEPTQFFFGGHLETRPIVEHITFRPNIEIGVGNHSALVAINLEFAYRYKLRTQPWDLYWGGGPAVVISHYGVRHPRHGDDSVGPGFNFMIGAQHREGLFAEVKAGLLDSPAVKFTVGYAFR